MTIKNHDRYLDPPDKPEIPICESCGKEMSILRVYDMYQRRVTRSEFVCNNDYCPDKHTGIAREMACKLADLEEELEEYKLRVRVLKNKIDTVSNYNKEKTKHE